jgi:hypothetical protein
MNDWGDINEDWGDMDDYDGDFYEDLFSRAEPDDDLTGFTGFITEQEFITQQEDWEEGDLEYTEQKNKRYTHSDFIVRKIRSGEIKYCNSLKESQELAKEISITTQSTQYIYRYKLDCSQTDIRQGFYISKWHINNGLENHIKKL